MAHKDPLINGVKCPSVTKIVGAGRAEGLERWKGMYGNAECDRYARETAAFGSTLHDLIDSNLSYQLDRIASPGVYIQGITERHHAMHNLFNDWQKETGFIPVETERFVLSHAYFYGGTFDAIGHFGDPDKLEIWDWKTSGKISLSYADQLAGYSQAYFEETGKRITKGGILRLERDPNKAPQIESKTFDNLDGEPLIKFLGLRLITAFPMRTKNREELLSCLRNNIGKRLLDYTSKQASPPLSS